jgi:hypothetical protein
MPRLERTGLARRGLAGPAGLAGGWRVPLAISLIITLGGSLWATATQAQLSPKPDEPALLYQAPIVIHQPAAFVRLPLPLQAYARSTQGPLNDLRVVDAQGQRVPFALLPEAAQPASSPAERWDDVSLCRLPPGHAAGKASGNIELQIHQGRVRLLAPASAGTSAMAANAPSPSAAAAPSPGWLFDLGQPAQRAGAARSLRLVWSGPAAFTASYGLEHSADLRQWQPAGSGQLLALSGSGGGGPAALHQPDVPLPPDTPRYVRLVWNSPPPHPELTGARSLTAVPSAEATGNHTQRLSAAPQIEPPPTSDTSPPGWVFDLGAAVPLSTMELQWPEAASGSRVLPATVQVRSTADEPWQVVGSTVFYRVDSGPAGAPATATRQPPAWPLNRQARWVRLVPDPRAGALPSQAPQLVAHAQLASLVFVPQGQPPFSLRVGAPRPASKATPMAAMPSGALPLATLVPDFATEQARFGQATVGEWREDPAAVEQARRAARLSQWRPWLLWAVLLGGVTTLGVMVWRLARPGRAGGAA